MNNCIISGRLGSEPVTKVTKTGVDVCSFSIANKHGWGDKEKTYWISCVAWKHTAKYIAENAHKGDLLVCEGILTQNSFDDKDGKKISRMDFNVNEVVIQKKQNQESKSVPEVTEADSPFSDDGFPF
jgi:single-strand DNA-binding protein